MKAQFVGLDFSVSRRRVNAIQEIIDDDENQSVALQMNFVGGSSLLCTVWTDWSLRIEMRSDAEISDYFWPREKYSRRSIIKDLPREGLGTLSLREIVDEVNAVIGIDIDVGGYRISARSVGGDMDLSVR